MRSTLSSQRQLAVKKLMLEIEVLTLDKIKREAELDLIKEDIRSKRTSRQLMRVTAVITGLTLVTTVLKYLGFFAR